MQKLCKNREKKKKNYSIQYNIKEVGVTSTVRIGNITVVYLSLTKMVQRITVLVEKTL